MNLLGTALGPLFDARGIGREPESGAIALYGPAPFASVTQTALQFTDPAASFSARLAAMAGAE